MIYSNNKSFILSILAVLMTLTSCIDDDFSCAVEDNRFPIDEIPEGIREGYSINLVASLDKLGGAAATAGDPLEEFENYIDPEKFRVLFFDHNDKFLFESKSRWVKKIDPSSSNSEWLVSVPVFTYGNDTYDYEYEDENGNTIEVKGDEWDWVAIREALTSNKFKVAILANRPELDYYPSFSDTKDRLPEHWYDNRGPFWYPIDTGKKDVFDLHHCQYDPMYHGKSKTTEKGVKEVGYYDFIMGDWDNTKISNDDDYATMRPKMGATCSWVDWDDNNKVKPSKYADDLKGKMDSEVRYTILPDNQHPIPMYGIQEFAAIGDNWIKGTPFNLSNLIANGGEEVDEDRFKKVSLLRSVVRLDLLIPKTYKRPKFVSMFYPNIYSRCEPMDVWTPTDQIWEDDHETKCEWNAIMNYGLVDSKDIKLGSTERHTNSKENFQKTMSWFYGAWKDKNWDFTSYINDDKKEIKVPDIPNIPYPRIFNTCIQRNKLVMCNVKGDVSDLYNDGYWHFVVYTGERNMIDPNTIPIMSDVTPEGESGGANAYAVSWMFKDEEKKEYYCIPIADYSKRQTYAKNCFGPYNAADITGNDIPKNNNKGSMYTYGNDLRDNVTERDDMPWPLLRNHIYRITVTGPSPKEIESDYVWDFTKSLNATSVYNLNTDTKWKNPGNVETKIISADYLPDASNTTGTKAVVSWGNEGGDWEGELTRRSAAEKFNKDNGTIDIDGTSYTPIKTGRGDDDETQEITDRTTNFTVPNGKSIKKLTLYSYVSIGKTTKSYALAEGETHRAGESVSVMDDLALLTFGFEGEEDFEAAKKEGSVTGFSAYTAGNGINGNAESGTCYIIQPKYDGNVEVGVVLNSGKPFYVLEDDSALDDYNGITVSAKYNGTYKFDVKGGKTYKVYCTGSKLGFYGFNYTYPSSNWESIESDAGDSYGPTKKMTAFKGDNKKDVAEFSINGARTVSFTNNKSGAQVCYVAAVEVERDVSTDYWEYKNPNGELKANSKYIPELQGLEFQSDGSLYVYEGNPSKIRLTGNTTITFPKLKDGATITIVSGEGVEEISGVNLSKNGDAVPEDGKYTSFWTVNNPDSETKITFNAGSTGIEFYEFRINTPSDTESTRSVGGRGGFRVKSQDLHSKSLKFN